MNATFNWIGTDSAALAQTASTESLPLRAALTGVYVITRETNSGMGMLLINPHPESWNNWLLPYGALTLPMNSPQKLPLTFADLTHELQDLKAVHLSDYYRSMRSDIEKLIGMNDCFERGNHFFSNYSLKFSKTANEWTAYCFSYHQCHQHNLPRANVTSTWLSLENEAIDRVIHNGTFDGLPVSENVVSLLAQPRNIEILRG